MFKRLLFVMLCYAIFTGLFACTQSPAVSEIQQTTATRSTSPTTSPSPTGTATETPLPLTETPPPTPTLAPVTQFIILEGDQLSLYDLETDSSLPLLSGLSLVADWYFSPDSGTVLISLAGTPLNESYAVNLANGKTVKIPTNVWYDVHSGGRALVGTVGFSQDLTVVDMHSGNPFATLPTEGWSAAPVFSPDGSFLAYAFGDTVFLHKLNYFQDEFVGVARDPTRISIPRAGIFVDRISWTPDSSRLIASAQLPESGNLMNETALFAVPLYGGKPVELASSGNLITGEMTWIYGFGSSPVGSRVAFTAYLYDPIRKFTSLPQLFIVNPDGTGLQRLTGSEDLQVGEAPNWLADGSLLFNTGHIYEDANTGNPSAAIVRMVRYDPVSGEMYELPRLLSIYAPKDDDMDLAFLIEKPFTFTCSLGWSRIGIDDYAVVSPGEPNRVRSAPQKGDNLLGTIQEGTVVKVIDGPVCADDLVYWKVESELLPPGWTAEGDFKYYWLEPYP